MFTPIKKSVQSVGPWAIAVLLMTAPIMVHSESPPLYLDAH